ncbi:hypothetical protein U14_01770 [Candidatus Moduliflexus flocculans]|uniref:Uncharacterized protein n=1 Tax=Candidatus Moduliflexus flocculans TaxID=1499966 RepID=A0A0S6VST2_9BACT|nr:hypothetical protein U14_01770 [Candidatus Moduliflexus flocculans]
MRYLWDTDTCIYYLNEDARIRENVRAMTHFHEHFTVLPLKRGEKRVTCSAVSVPPA